MKRDSLLKPVAIAFAIALIGYATLYSCDSHLRTRKGPWQVEFTADTNGVPAIIIHQPALGVERFQLVFAGERAPTNFSPATIRFDTPKQKVPVGEFLYHDLMYLPGVVSLNLFGHGIELLPRTLIVDGREEPWRATAMLDLKPEAKKPLPPVPKKKKRY